MREIVHFTVMVEDRSPSHWQDIAMAALQPFGPKDIDSSPFGRVIELEFDYYPEGLDAVVAHLKRQHIGAFFNVRRQYTAAERRQAELLILGGEGVVSSVEGTFALGGSFDLSLLRLSHRGLAVRTAADRRAAPGRDVRLRGSLPTGRQCGAGAGLARGPGHGLGAGAGGGPTGRCSGMGCGSPTGCPP